MKRIFFFQNDWKFGINILLLQHERRYKGEIEIARKILEKYI
jgi:hypothetical protein